MNMPQKLPGITPPLLTPGGRRLPPLGLSPGSHMIPTTPGGTLWNSLLNATNTSHEHDNDEPHDAHVPLSGHPSVNHGPSNSGSFAQFLGNRKSGLTPNESNIRTGFTPGGNGHPGFPFNNQLVNLTPNGILNSPMTPGLSSLLGLTSQPLNMMQQPMHGQQAMQGPIGSTQNSALHGEQAQAQAQAQIQAAQLQAQIQAQAQAQAHAQAAQAQAAQAQAQAQAAQAAQAQAQAAQAQARAQAAQAAQTQAPQSVNKPRSQEIKIPQITTLEPDSLRESENKEDTSKRSLEPSETPQSKKPKTARGRKPKVKDEPPILESPISSPSSPGENKENRKKPQTEEEKRKHFLERNRLAASKCRQRKKQMVAKMGDELKMYQTGYKELRDQVDSIRDHLLNIRSVIMNHKNCNMLISQLGGYNEMNHFIDQVNFVTSIAEKGGVSNNNNIPSISSSENYSITPSTSMPHSIPVSDSRATNSGANSVNIPNGYETVNVPANIASHHSMTNMAAAVNNNNNSGQVNGIHNGIEKNHSDIRAINSMSDLASLNQGNLVNDGKSQDFNLRTVNSMVNLPQHGNNLVDLNHNI